ncbi:Arginine biosynthesis bifunctional protein ArgJ [Nitrospina gracilis 3/211]|uniref:Arginine biosynthesis bifunctional protein ArgJ n=1 Tax=Nitrospina gracilis (strain 3/211) TaxID=1266370 RepID=M1YWK5_NITG3|nr:MULTISPECIES: bifunctional glutamate N-acetyltransferase/amino-acid acetyltransferase ArgJ [Nitrospina]MCF8722914.1 glutamate N-acetyltransferase/amino-acid N-acetyltransferase [Nitrospina sp. Nb-3]CCQ89879.1 Arginine biosynthesis bifunctional protein ArgJ [Nitrospina gracilis 3/211]
MKLKTKKTLSVPGFKAGGVACGIKKNGKPDLALIVSDTAATAAGLFTTNRVVSPTVTVTKQHIQSAKSVRAIVANSGNANACTGTDGDRTCRDMVALTAKQLGVTDKEVLVASTGVIGVKLPLAPVKKGLPQLGGALSPKGWNDAAEAILTTDLVIKTACVESNGITVGGIAKGSGMIHPNMATMLAFLATNANIGKADLKAALKVANEHTFNRINVDGDTSTNDMVVILANGQAGNASIKKGTKAFRDFVEALTAVCKSLAFAIVKDGEGATKFVTVSVKGAKTEKHALTVSRAVADSKLVQTALFGEDPNWGRIIAAVGYAGVPVKPEKIDIAFNGTPLVKNGAPVAGLSVTALHKQMKAKDLRIDIGLGMGKASAETYTCDLSYDYVRINAEYTT